MKVGVSACLLGERVRYDGKEKRNEALIRLLENHEVIPLCPEVFGGLSVPRIPSERCGEKVVNQKGEDVSAAYQKGSEIALAKLKENGIHTAILKARSPACGKGMIYDGTFSRTLTERDGTFAELCRKNNIALYTEEELSRIRAALDKEDNGS